MENIIIASEHKNTLAKEFGVSLQSVRMSLQGVFKSVTAQKIRARAKELLTEEANKIEKTA